MRFGVTILIVAAFIGVSSATSAIAPAVKVLRARIRPPQLGADWSSRPYPGGTQVTGQVTLDMCGYRFASEALRVARFQGAYFRGSSNEPALSNEVVAYRAGRALQAMQEVRRAIATCPSGFTKSKVGHIAAQREAITKIQLRGLLHGSIAFSDRLTVNLTNGRVVTSNIVVVFQERADVLSAVYVFARHPVLLAARVAPIAARDLARL